jgi:putative component of membrane protein insertase Oxa1/YidC/SpoIIIJ protein YidD
MLHLYKIDRLLAMAACAAVIAYRKFISPYKGYRCACAAITGGPSCSEVALLALRSHKFVTACHMIVNQLKLCGKSYRKYKTSNKSFVNSNGRAEVYCCWCCMSPMVTP